VCTFYSCNVAGTAAYSYRFSSGAVSLHVIYIHQEPKIFAILPPTRKRQQLTAMEGNGCRNKVSAYVGGGVATNLTKSNMWEQVENVFS
jgi:hypothetical protein